MKNFYTFQILLSLCIITVYADFPCIPKFANESIVCVCNSTYCDTITREVPNPGNYFTYTSSKFGKRFSKTNGVIKEIKSLSNNDYDYGMVLELQPERLYQSIEGFGGAVTDSVGVNLKSLSLAARQNLINSYFSKDGIEYNMIRVPAGSTDFSNRYYAYNEFPRHDKRLSNFTLAPEDIDYKVPTIHECQKVATDEVKFVTAVWAPPKWMMVKDHYTGFRVLNEKFYQVYADYLCKFAQLYYGQGIKIWGLAAANEPLITVIANIKKETMSWTSPKLAKFMKEYLGPTIRNCSVQGIKILANEDQRYALPLWFSGFNDIDPDVFKYIDGVAVHYYGDIETPGAILARAMKDFPDKFLISTEACKGVRQKFNVDLGSWKRAKSYILDILEDLNYNVVGWIDWNMCLNSEGGPTWVKNFVDSPVIVNAEKQEFYKQPMYYALGHFSKFIPRGSRRIRVVKRVPVLDPNLDMQDIEAMGQKIYDNVAFLTPRGTIVVVIHNDGPSLSTAIQIGTQQISITLDDESITTIEFLYKDC